ncbi:hypothetical protein [Nocardioides litoris]|uniref:hypothetical protein n=1 Tax=Nocardioides litoris TaxID=1926648 RepID=UPI00111D32F8|nr:hypothetical protein [Nocardioides litoris]
MSKLTVAVIFAAGYVVGARAGRDRYEQIRAQAQKVADNPRVQSAAGSAKEKAGEVAATAAAAAKDKAAEAVDAAKERVGSDHADGTGGPSTSTGI